MSTNRQDLITLITNRLKTVSSLHSRVYEYEPDAFVGFPTVTVAGNGYRDRIADNQRNIREYIFDINVYFDRSKLLSGPEKAERIRRELEDEILTSFDSYRDLDDNALWITHESGGWAYSGDNSIAFFVITLMVNKAITITS